MSLSKTQQRALKLLTREFRSALHIGESFATLNALVTKGYAVRRAPNGTHNPRPSEVMYKLKES